MFYFHPETWGRFPILTFTYFSNGLVQRPTSSSCHVLLWDSLDQTTIGIIPTGPLGAPFVVSRASRSLTYPYFLGNLLKKSCIVWVAVIQ